MQQAMKPGSSVRVQTWFFFFVFFLQITDTYEGDSLSPFSFLECFRHPCKVMI